MLVNSNEPTILFGIYDEPIKCDVNSMNEDGSTMALSDDERIDLLRTMRRIREFEEKVVEEYFGGQTAGTMFHISEGEEGVAAGAVRMLEDKDYVTSHHRAHGIAVSKGLDLREMMAEILGREDGVCDSRGGSMHTADFDKGHINSNAIVGANVPLGTGAGLSIKQRGEDRISVNFFGDGGLNQGILYESMNMAALWDLPVVFVVVNNQYGMGTHIEDASASQQFAKRAETFGLHGFEANGMDVEEMAEISKKAFELARSGEGPAFIEGKCYRFFGHGRKDDSPYRDDEEEKRWRQEDPIDRQKQRLIEEEIMTEADYEQMVDDVQQKMDEAAEWAEDSPHPDLKSMVEGVYAETFPGDPTPGDLENLHITNGSES